MHKLIFATFMTLCLTKTVYADEPAGRQQGNSAALDRIPLAALCADAFELSRQRHLNTAYHTPWQIMQMLYGVGPEFQLRDGGEVVSGLSWISAGPKFEGKAWFEVTEHGGRVHPSSRPYGFEVFPNQFLAAFAIAGVKRSQVLKTDGDSITVGDCVNQAQFTVDAKQNLIWTLMALSHYLPAGATWENKAGEVWSIERVAEQVSRSLLSGQERGLGPQELVALAFAKRYQPDEVLAGSPTWKAITAQIDSKIDGLNQSHHPGGSVVNRDVLLERLADTGHAAEFVMYAASKADRKEEWFQQVIRNAAQALVDSESKHLPTSGLIHNVAAVRMFLVGAIPATAKPATDDAGQSTSSGQSVSKNNGLRKASPADAVEADASQSKVDQRPLPQAQASGWDKLRLQLVDGEIELLDLINEHGEQHPSVVGFKKRLQILKENLAKHDADQSPASQQSPDAVEDFLKLELVKLEIQKSSLMEKLGAEHPIMIRKSKQVKLLKEKLAEHAAHHEDLQLQALIDRKYEQPNIAAEGDQTHRDATRKELISELAKVESDLAAQSKQYGEKHPSIQDLKQRAAALRAALAAAGNQTANEKNEAGQQRVPDSASSIQAAYEQAMLYMSSSDRGAKSFVPPADRKFAERKRDLFEVTFRETEQESLAAAAAYRAEAAQKSPDADALKNLQRRLQMAVKKSFEAQSRFQEARLHLAELELKTVKARLELRKALSKQVIERRVEELKVGTELSWQMTENSNGTERAATVDAVPNYVKSAKEVPKQDTQKLLEDWLKDARPLGDDADAKRDSTIEQIREALNSEQHSLQIVAATALAQLGDVKFDKKQFRPRILELCRSNNAEVQRWAFYALLNNERQDGDLALLQEVMAEPVSGRLAESASHLLQSFDKGVIRGKSEVIVLRLLNSSDKSLRREVLRGLWGAKYGEKITNRVIELVDNKESHHDAIYYALSTSPEKTPAAIDKLIEVLSDPDWNNWGRAIWGMGYGVPEDQQTKVAAAMLQMYELRSDPKTRGKCERLVRVYGDAKQIKKLETLTGNSTSAVNKPKEGAATTEPQPDQKDKLPDEKVENQVIDESDS
ncbi:HEAT repeat domain-containing protein [Fuerstiella marisgermanici]|uniref:HEAT repeat protein n=1 Tax=Fuerstiella marisgermanici TaxID=1891926 RepID=A0A1P8WEM7_9PLAN|nr:hypothetical protein [Fuerstiella marisgermanici]APZ92477.1 hypothetical protein Fuma_02088 [Fuerstiella marisgermanici]